jgi:ADP-ribose pyrophosphatase YjhB (NUDIX family)
MAIPASAERVFKGVIFDVYQWQQTMFDGSKATFERLKRPSTLTVIAVQDGSIVMAEEQQPDSAKYLSLFGGRQEEGEDPLSGAKRELLEEAGLASDDWELYQVYEPVAKIDWRVYVYIARNCRSVAEQKLDAGERITVKKFSVEEFLNLSCTKAFSDRDLSADIMRMKLDEDSAALDAFKNKIIGL